MVFAVATAGVADVAWFHDVSGLANTLVMVQARIVNKAAETIFRDHFMPCSREALVSTVWMTAFQPIPAAKGMHVLSSTCLLC